MPKAGAQNSCLGLRKFSFHFYKSESHINPDNRRYPERRHRLEPGAVEFVFEDRFVIEKVDDFNKRFDLASQDPSCKPVTRIGREEPVEPPGKVGLRRVNGCRPPAHAIDPDHLGAERPSARSGE